MYLFVPCDKKSHGTEISFPIGSNRLSHPHPLCEWKLRETTNLISKHYQILTLEHIAVLSVAH